MFSLDVSTVTPSVRTLASFPDSIPPTQSCGMDPGNEKNR